jgi:hypothetical protein
MSPTPQIHYSPFLRLTILRSEGEGACGKSGSISGYRGMITCKTCLKIFDDEETTRPARMETERRPLLNNPKQVSPFA